MKNSEKVNQDQRRYLLAEIQKHYRNKWDFQKEELPPSLKKVKAQISRLQAQITAHQRRQEKNAKAKVKLLEKAISEARQHVYFGTPEQALAALESLRKRFPVSA